MDRRRSCQHHPSATAPARRRTACCSGCSARPTRRATCTASGCTRASCGTGWRTTCCTGPWCCRARRWWSWCARRLLRPRRRERGLSRGLGLSGARALALLRCAWTASRSWRPWWPPTCGRASRPRRRGCCACWARAARWRCGARTRRAAECCTPRGCWGRPETRAKTRPRPSPTGPRCRWRRRVRARSARWRWTARGCTRPTPQRGCRTARRSG